MNAHPSDTRRPIPLTSAILRDAEEKGKIEIYRALLSVALDRLNDGRALEKEHGVVHPEMTAIGRDVARLTEIVFGSEKATVDPALKDAVKKHGKSRLARAMGVPALTLDRWMRDGMPDEERRKLDDLLMGGG